MVLITAREGSKRLKNKNIRYLKGLRLVEHTLKFALKNFKRKDILLSTDSKFIRNIAIKRQIPCPWLRPKHISSDKATSYEVILHSVKWYEKKYGKINYIILLQPTSPFRRINTLKKCLNLSIKHKEYNIKTITEAKSRNNNKHILFCNYLCKNNGSYYIFPRSNLNKKKNYLSKNKYVFVRENIENIDIDNIYDYRKALKI